MTRFLLAVSLLLQSPQYDSIRSLLGQNFKETMRLLDERNQIYFRSQGLTTAQIERSRANLEKPPDKLPADTKVVPLDSHSIGASLVAVLSGKDLTAEQVNLVFCSVGGQSERLVAMQVLFSDPRRLGNADLLALVKQIYALPESVAFDAHRPALKYPLPGISYSGDGHWHAAPDAEPITVWNLEATEAVFQPVASPTLRGQLWITGKTVANECAREARDH